MLAVLAPRLVAVVVEQVHERAEQKEPVRQGAKHVRAVLCKEKEAGYGEEPNQG